MSEISFSMKMDWLQCIGQSDEAIRGFKLNMLLYELLSLLYSRFVSEVRRPELVRSERNITMQIIGYMTSHRKQHLEATDVAREFGYGREHFCRPFRKATGKTFKEFLTDLRLDDACRKLSGSSASIASIARECGFPDTRALQTAVQRKYGIRAGIPRTIRKSKPTSNKTSNMKRRKYDWACTNHPSYEN